MKGLLPSSHKIYTLPRVRQYDFYISFQHPAAAAFGLLKMMRVSLCQKAEEQRWLYDAQFHFDLMSGWFSRKR